MKIGVVREMIPGERRVALVPASVQPLVKAGCTVLVENGAGDEAGFPTAEYVEKGAGALERAQVFAEADVILQVTGPGADAAASTLGEFREGQTVVAMQDPLGNPHGTQSMASRGMTAFSLELVPRITRAQSMDVLSSMATVAGYQAVLEAAAVQPKLFPMMMTAAGTLAPAKVFVVGVGVAGLQAIVTAKRLGGVVEAYDVRPAVKDQVVSVGAKFVEFDLETGDAEDKGGYAKAQSDDFIKRQQEQMAADRVHFLQYHQDTTPPDIVGCPTDIEVHADATRDDRGKTDVVLIGPVQDRRADGARLGGEGDAAGRRMGVGEARVEVDARPQDAHAVRAE